MSHTAGELRISRLTLYELMQKLGDKPGTVDCKAGGRILSDQVFPRTR
jgi:hypothetical protein